MISLTCRTVVLGLILAGGGESALAQRLTTLHAFSGGADGALPRAPVIYENGTLYGTTFQGGGFYCLGSGCGTVFKLNVATRAETVLHAFLGSSAGDGAYPAAGLLYEYGLLFGSTENGGPLDDGTLFSVNPRSGVETVLHRFSNGADGGLPTAALVSHGGAFFSTDTLNSGEVFSTDPATGVVTDLYRFHGRDGQDPLNGVIYRGGLLYGSTYEGGPKSYGEIFSLSPSGGAPALLWSFDGGADGGSPAGVTYEAGALYGTTYRGGNAGCGAGCGTIFKLDLTTGAETVLYQFSGGADGQNPQSSLLYLHGALYGTNRGANAGCETNGCGTVFRYDLSTRVFTTLYRFTGGSDGGLPLAGLVYADHAFYGTTDLGGNLNCNAGNGCGTVFRLTQ